jgi:hypothetical protein
MATEALTAQYVNRSGTLTVINAVTSADGFTFPNDGHTLMWVINDAGALNLVFTIHPTLDGQTVTRTVTVTASQAWIIGPFPPELYSDPLTGLVTCTPDADLTGVTEGIAIVSF